MLGSSDSVSEANVVLNTSVAEELRQFADELESAADLESALHSLIKRVISEHKRIIFNGNGYDEAWLFEAEKRGLLNLRTTPDCLPYLVKEKNVDLFTRHRVYSEAELHARYEILTENYCKMIGIESLTMLDMVNKDILPSVAKFTGELSDEALAKKALLPSADCRYEETVVRELSELTGAIYAKKTELEELIAAESDCADSTATAVFCKEKLIPCMTELRILIDETETKTDASYWPYPSYGETLFSVK